MRHHFRQLPLRRPNIWRLLSRRHILGRRLSRRHSRRRHLSRRHKFWRRLTRRLSRRRFLLRRHSRRRRLSRRHNFWRRRMRRLSRRRHLPRRLQSWRLQGPHFHLSRPEWLIEGERVLLQTINAESSGQPAVLARSPTSSLAKRSLRALSLGEEPT